MKIIKISEVEGTMLNNSQRFIGSVNFKNLIDEKIPQSYWAFSAGA